MTKFKIRLPEKRKLNECVCVCVCVFVCGCLFMSVCLCVVSIARLRLLLLGCMFLCVHKGVHILVDLIVLIYLCLLYTQLVTVY